ILGWKSRKGWRPPLSSLSPDPVEVRRRDLIDQVRVGDVAGWLEVLAEPAVLLEAEHADQTVHPDDDGARRRSPWLDDDVRVRLPVLLEVPARLPPLDVGVGEDPIRLLSVPHQLVEVRQKVRVVRQDRDDQRSEAGAERDPGAPADSGGVGEQAAAEDVDEREHDEEEADADLRAEREVE